MADNESKVLCSKCNIETLEDVVEDPNNPGYLITEHYCPVCLKVAETDYTKPGRIKK